MTRKSKQLIKALLVLIVIISVTGYCMDSPEKVSEYFNKIATIDQPK